MGTPPTLVGRIAAGLVVVALTACASPEASLTNRPVDRLRIISARVELGKRWIGGWNRANVLGRVELPESLIDGGDNQLFAPT